MYNLILKKLYGFFFFPGFLNFLLVGMFIFSFNFLEEDILINVFSFVIIFFFFLFYDEFQKEKVVFLKKNIKKILDIQIEKLDFYYNSVLFFCERFIDYFGIVINTLPNYYKIFLLKMNLLSFVLIKKLNFWKIQIFAFLNQILLLGNFNYSVH